MNKRPNILIVIADQVNGRLFENGPADYLKVPHLRRWFAQATNFSNSYTGSPLCSPARASLMTGQLPSHTGVYDNAAEFPSSLPTYAHHLRRAGYQTLLSGKMHFVGPDQLHGFEKRLTTDVYPADFGWTPDYRKPGERIDWWYHNLGSVTGAGVAETSNQMEYDDEVAFFAEQALFNLARGHDQRPWCMTVSFTHPHDPYVARRTYWDRYQDCPALMPEIAAVPFQQQDAHSQRLMKASEFEKFEITDRDIQRARRGYFANLSFIDDKFGSLLDVLERTRMRDNTIVLFLSDHGDMLGERGLWFKMSPREGSARVPLAIQLPGQQGGTIDTPVSTLDLNATLADLVGIDLSEVSPWSDGESLLPLLRGESGHAPVAMEYAAEGTEAPLVTLRDGRYKYNHCELDPPQLFDLENDPHESHNLIEEEAYAELAARFAARVAERWNMTRFDNEVRESQARRLVVYKALRQGHYFPWDYQPLQAASERYMRNHMDLNTLEEDQRFPRGE
ncbi:choline-sulfatase [Carnimonas bestiolae]|uniref:choline-sulfatase n=1 Tax=Carnimonas bestiolae TaxID=3402172 RepID=UPI003EDC1D6F